MAKLKGKGLEAFRLYYEELRKNKKKSRISKNNAKKNVEHNRNIGLGSIAYILIRRLVQQGKSYYMATFTLLSNRGRGKNKHKRY